MKFSFLLIEGFLLCMLFSIVFYELDISVKWFLWRRRKMLARTKQEQFRCRWAVDWKKGNGKGFERKTRNNENDKKWSMHNKIALCCVGHEVKSTRVSREFPCDARKPRTKFLLLTSLSFIEWISVSVVLTSQFTLRREKQKPPLTFSNTSLALSPCPATFRYASDSFGK